MFKQIFSRISRKSLKSDSAELPRASSGPSSSSSTGSNGVNSGSSGRPNAARRPSSAVFPASVVAGIEPLVPFKDVPLAEKMNLFVSKVSLCCVTFDFSDPGKNTLEKDVKRETLIELVDFVDTQPLKFTEPAILAMCRMCAVNLFRVFPPNDSSKHGGGENDDDVPMFDAAWPHLHIVYQVLLNFVNSPCLDAKIGKKYIDHSYILRLLDLFESEDPRERDCLKTIMHRIYGKFMVHRPFIRKAIGNIFYRFVFETEKHNGIAELLEIFGSVISGFALPLKEEHKIFLRRALIPLHKPTCLGSYFQQLSYCITQFIEKDPKIASVVINGLLKYWPITSSQKEVTFLSEIEEILEAINMVEFQKIMVPLFRRIGYCMNNYHFQVAERALFLWNNDQIINLVVQNRHVILPIILPALEKNTACHWNQAVLNLSQNVRKLLLEMDEALFLSCEAHYREEEGKPSQAEEKRKQAWERIENAASLKPVTGNTPVLVTPLGTSVAC